MPSTAPVVPPRPSRSPRPGPSAPSSDVPKIPPRPSNRRLERSTSPGRGSFAHSPLNEISSSDRTQSQDESSSNLPSSSPSVTLPTLGHEGIEYEDSHPETTADSQSEAQEPLVEQKRDIGSDVKLHAPKPSLPTSTARAEVHAVTHTNPQQAAAVGSGKMVSPNPDQPDLDSRPLVETNSSQTGSNAPSIERRTSTQLGDEQGIPEIGQQLPMYPVAGDVQAPSASSRDSVPTSPSHARSSREMQPDDKFEKVRYDKYPDELVREEQGQYGPGLSTERADSTLSSEKLNKIAGDSASRGAGLGTPSTAMAAAEAELGYIASEEFTSRFTSPKPINHDLEISQSKESPAAVEPPPRKLNHPTDEATAYEDEQLRESSDIWNEDADSRNKEGFIHIDEPRHHQHGHGDTHTNSQDDQDHDKEDNAPFLASDEVEPNAAHMQPAISSPLGRDEGDHTINEQEAPKSPLMGGPGSRLGTHSNVPTKARLSSREDEIEEIYTPSEDLKEYEPLPPEDGNKDKENEPLSSTDLFKQRPEQIEYNSSNQGQDTWEESPNSVQLHTASSTPDVPDYRGIRGSGNSSESSNGEVAPKEETRKEDVENLALQIEESKNPLEEEAADRPDMKQRFPSSDVWEDAPETHRLAATVQTPEPGETRNHVETVASKPSIPPRPDTNKAGEQSKDTSVPPPIPSRPQKRVLKAPPFNTMEKSSQSNAMNTSQAAVSPTESRKVPVLPDRPKPQVPTRPARPAARGSSESLSRINSGGSAENGETSRDVPTVPKSKPTVPAKPVGSKIAALKAGFLSDLDKTLLAGPKPPEKKEKPEAPAEKGPLSDARKGRARGPARRKPAVATLPKAETLSTESVLPEIKITSSWSVWQVNEDGAIIVGGDEEPVEKLSTPEPSGSPKSSTKDNTNDATETASLEAVEDKVSPTKELPVGEVIPDSDEFKLSIDETPKVGEPDSPTISSPVETSPLPGKPTDKSDEDGTKDDEQPQPEAVPVDTIEPKEESPPVPFQSKDDQDPGDEDATPTDKELEQSSPPVDAKRHAEETPESEG